MTDYDGKEFLDPVVRCDACDKIVHRIFIQRHAGCCHCGNKRFRNVRGVTGEEKNGLAEGTLKIGLKPGYKIDPDFLELFQPAEEITDE